MSETETRPEGPLTASVEKLRQELDRWLDVAVSQGGRALDAFGLRGEKSWSPAIDLIEQTDDVLVLVDLPGVAPSAVDVTLVGNMLTLKGKRPDRPQNSEETVHPAERPTGEFCRSIPMPAPVDPEQVSAEAREGVLRIRLAKTERAKPRQIPVQIGGQQQSDHQVEQQPEQQPAE